MLNIRIKTQLKKWIPRDDVGNWYTKKGTDEIRVANQENPDHEVLLAIHELLEQYLCKKYGITSKQVDEWDKNNKLKGDDKKSPYHIPHILATKLEKYSAKLLKVNWKNYEESL